MVPNYHAVLFMAKARHEHILEDARKSEMLKAIKPKRIQLWKRMLLRFAEVLIFLGSRIKNRYQPLLHTDSDSVPPRADSTNINACA